MYPEHFWHRISTLHFYKVSCVHSQCNTWVHNSVHNKPYPMWYIHNKKHDTRNVLHTHEGTHPSFSIRCLWHMFIVVCLTSMLSVRRLTTIPSMRGPAIESSLRTDRMRCLYIIPLISWGTFIHIIIPDKWGCPWQEELTLKRLNYILSLFRVSLL